MRSGAIASRAIRLGQHERHIVAGCDDGLQGLGGKIRCPGKYQPHAVTRACLAILFLMRACLSIDR